jgi:hypothetical protein
LAENIDYRKANDLPQQFSLRAIRSNCIHFVLSPIAYQFSGYYEVVVPTQALSNKAYLGQPFEPAQSRDKKVIRYVPKSYIKTQS